MLSPTQPRVRPFFNVRPLVIIPPGAGLVRPEAGAEPFFDFIPFLLRKLLVAGFFESDEYSPPSDVSESENDEMMSASEHSGNEHTSKSQRKKKKRAVKKGRRDINEARTLFAQSSGKAGAKRKQTDMSSQLKER